MTQEIAKAEPREAALDAFIKQAALDPQKYDLDRIERLIVMRDQENEKYDNAEFNIALAEAQGQLKAITADQRNDATRSRYTSLPKIINDIQQVVADNGFHVTFNTEPTGVPDLIRVVGFLSRGRTMRRYAVDMPITTKGPRGNDVMAPTHATMSSITYGRRALLGMMFNLATGGDDDGNGGRQRTGNLPPAGPAVPPTPTAAPQPPADAISEVVDPDTGAVTKHVEPFVVAWAEDDNARAWGAKFISAVRAYSRSLTHVDGFAKLNEGNLDRMKAEREVQYTLLQQSFDEVRKSFEVETA